MRRKIKHWQVLVQHLGRKGLSLAIRRVIDSTSILKLEKSIKSSLIKQANRKVEDSLIRIIVKFQIRGFFKKVKGTNHYQSSSQ